MELVYLALLNRHRVSKGVNIIQDRYFASIASYLPSTKRFYNCLLLKIGRMILLSPDMLIYCTASKQTIIQRLKSDSENKYHQWLIDNPEYIGIRQNEYKKYFQQFKKDKVTINTSFYSPEQATTKALYFIKTIIDRKDMKKSKRR